MKKFMICLMAIVCAMSMTLDAQVLRSRQGNKTNGSKIAVYVSGDADAEFEEAIAAEFTNWLMKAPCFTVLARDGGCLNSMIAEQNYLHKLSSESNYQTSGEVSSDQIRELGRKFGVKYVYAVRVNNIRGEYNLSARRINVESGHDMQSWSASGPVDEVEDMVALTKQLASSSKVNSCSGGYGKRTFTANGVSFDMVSVDGGQFNMGATFEQDEYENDERPVHLVTLGSYMIGETEVTQELWQAVMGLNPSEIRGSKRPVENISWSDCQEFIARLNQLTGQHFRLPTEAEWEFAARGGNKAQNTKYSGSNNIYEVAWFDGNSGSMTHDVKSKLPNQLGIYDMSGNVWEWCQDWYGDYSSNSQTNPTGPSSGSFRVLRGGSWYSFARNCRVSNRSYSAPSFRSYCDGLRLAL